ncbi:protein kinase [Trypanosoma grayi]|uniref:protein kinase n=1 Tax=Trypanosoma grayi TaxID=71804 RepID=UPI0004F433D6|nr:protein kinase [Trypanosoma grayi]KEG14086.1 protein kinase [Trypanosoma grayi]
MSSPTWSVYEGGSDDSFEKNKNNNGGSSRNGLPPERSLRGCGLRQKALLQRGAQGAVYLAEDADGNTFAVKRLFTQRSDFGVRGISEGALREAALLSLIARRAAELDLEGDFGVVRLHGVVEAPFHELCLILEMCPLDISRVFIRKRKRSQGICRLNSELPPRCPILAKMNLIQYLMRGILKVVLCLHERCHIVHRDLKPGNLLIGANGQVRLADFGSARLMHDDAATSTPDSTCGEYTPTAIRTTVIYQSPECILGERAYTTTADMWAVGVLFAEMLLQQHLFTSRSELAVLSEIWKLLGTPSDDTPSSPSSMPPAAVTPSTGESALTYAVRTEPTIALKFPETIVNAEGLDLLKAMLTLTPGTRITAADALRHPFLSSDAAKSGDAEARLLWQEKVRACAQEAARPVAVGMQSLFRAGDESDSGGEDDGNRMCVF